MSFSNISGRTTFATSYKFQKSKKGEVQQNIKSNLKEAESATMNIFRKFLFSFEIICKRRIKLCFPIKSIRYS